MDLRIFVEPQQGSDYEEQLACALTAERLGFDAFFRSDHLLAMGGDGMPGPTDSWITLAGLARETSEIRLGTLVTSATFRHPSVLAITVAEVDAMSHGRVELGLGTGWFAAEHAAYGIPFAEKRFGPFEEQLAVITGLWSTPIGEHFSFAGEHYTLTDSPALPKPVQNPVPIIVGGGGANRTPRIAAAYAHEFNVPFTDEDSIRARFDGVRRACEAIDRDPASMVFSVALGALMGTDEADYRRRIALRGKDADDFRAQNIAGSASEALDRIGRLAELGASRVYLQTELASDLEQVELFGTEVLPHAG